MEEQNTTPITPRVQLELIMTALILAGIAAHKSTLYPPSHIDVAWKAVQGIFKIVLK